MDFFFKSTVKDGIISYARDKSQKILILCNRRLLREQYWYKIIKDFSRYADLTSTVDVLTYQSLAEKLRTRVDISLLFQEYHYIVCDEAHYFYADSGFNGFGTYVVLQAIITGSVSKTLIFMSATLEETKRFIEEVVYRFVEYKRRQGYDYGRYFQGLSYDFSCCADYSRFSCVAFPDPDSLLDAIYKQQGKAIVFIDNKSRAQEWLEKLRSKGKKDIKFLCAENLKDGVNAPFVEKLVMTNKLECQVLFTTSVLDNGVSIEDDDIESMTIITDFKISFLQMLGRVRAGVRKQVFLYFLARDEKEFAKRENELAEFVDVFKAMEEVEPECSWESHMMKIWDDPNERFNDFYRRATIWTPHEMDFFNAFMSKFLVHRGKLKLTINRLTQERVGDEYLQEAKFHSMARRDPLDVIREQMRWLDKSGEDLRVEDSTYLEDLQKELISELLKVNSYSKEQFSDLKKRINQKYRKALFPEIICKPNMPFENAKLEMILNKFALELVASEDESGHKRYTILKKEDKGEEVQENA